ncbi:MAG: PASTA domain-containing protein [Muribaculaceae bacterium]|nr:PASTA domain-containing protein [Muribaculaceae bacterium]MBQ2563396.1 PASTA domain-containing protein [Muribaculaceae bacterium]MBQ5409644.1 PASTA domain-containing protein [Muribaculaceae bacterium]MDY6293169.1 PASTA domain-containing protein [Bacteroidales bacterium]MDY6413016.1 PASTA domain-containing protein [Bacteroidales bacterium]
MFGDFGKQHPVLMNALGVIITFVAAWYAIYLLIDVFTLHGQEAKVPSVRNMSLDNAIRKIEAAGFEWEISDSMFNEAIKPGMVLEQEPKGNAMAKTTRIIHLTINAFNPKTVNLPILSDISCRDAVNRLTSMGFKFVKVDTVPSADEGLVLSVKVNGHPVTPGSKVSIKDQISIEVGDGLVPEMPFDVLPDNVQDSLQRAQRARAAAEPKEQQP